MTLTRRAVLSLLGATAAPFSLPACGSTRAVSVPSLGAEFPMLDFGGRPVVELTINGKGPFKMIVDTGASVTVLDTTLATQLGLGGTNPEIDEMRIGPIALAGLDAFVLPIGQMLRGEDVPRGVLSASVFPGHLFTFDYPGRKMSVLRGALPQADGQTVFSYKGDDLPAVPVKVAGKEISVHLDTGAPFSVALPTRYLKELPLVGEPVQNGTARTHAGALPIFEAVVAGEVMIGKYKLDVPKLRFTDVVPDPNAKPRGQVGAAALRYFVVTIDAANERLQLARPA